MAAAARTLEDWRELVSAWRASGEPATVFARERGVHPHTLRWWAWRLGSVARKRAAVRFAEVVVAEATPVRDFVVELEHVRVRVPAGFDAGELRRLLAALC